MRNESEAKIERAIINVQYARAELVTAKDAEAIFRALEHIEEALSELRTLAPRYGTQAHEKAA